jgi:release factor glutamine methyltransferase
VPRADAGFAPATVGGALAQATSRLAAAGCDTPRLDAEVLLGSVLEVDRGRLVIDRDLALGSAAVARFEALLARRGAREPVAYILGRRAFRRLELAVDRRVLIPRPETELLVEVGLSLPSGARVVDVGTGSGAVALALKDERPDLVVRGVDVSVDAVDVARANAVATDLSVEFAVGDLLEGLSVAAGDAVLANLPYVADGADLSPEIARYEPPGALFAGADGLDVVRRLVAAVAGPSVALLALEIGPDQAVSVQQLLSGSGFAEVAVRHDLAGLERVVVGTA